MYNLTHLEFFIFLFLFEEEACWAYFSEDEDSSVAGLVLVPADGVTACAAPGHTAGHPV